MQSMEPDKETVRKMTNIRLRVWLRQHTHFRNTHEFFVALLFELGPPPHPITDLYICSLGTLGEHDYTMMNRWRSRVQHALVDKLPSEYDSKHVTREYLKWLLRQQESKSISVL